MRCGEANGRFVSWANCFHIPCHLRWEQACSFFLLVLLEHGLKPHPHIRIPAFSQRKARYGIYCLPNGCFNTVTISVRSLLQVLESWWEQLIVNLFQREENTECQSVDSHFSITSWSSTTVMLATSSPNLRKFALLLYLKQSSVLRRSFTSSWREVDWHKFHFMLVSCGVCELRIWCVGNKS